MAGGYFSYGNKAHGAGERSVQAHEHGRGNAQIRYDVVAEAADAEAALALAESTKPNLAILDLEANSGSLGADFPQRLRALLPSLSIVLMTSDSSSSSARKPSTSALPGAAIMTSVSQDRLSNLIYADGSDAA